MKQLDKNLPCPFCGSDELDVYEDSGWWVAQCWNCSARVDPSLKKEAVIERWNTRVDVTEGRGRL